MGIYFLTAVTVGVIPAQYRQLTPVKSTLVLFCNRAFSFVYLMLQSQLPGGVPCKQPLFVLTIMDKQDKTELGEQADWLHWETQDQKETNQFS